MEKKYSFIYGSLLILVFCSASFFSQTKTIPYQELPNYQGVVPGSGIFFGASMTSSSITVTFAGPSDRWIAFGLGNFMYPTDVFIYSNGKSNALHALGWNDYYNTSSSATDVNNDLTQNWNILSTGTVAPGTRTVVATRTLSTGDLNDVVVNFNATALNLVWAKGATADYTVAYHGLQFRAYGISLPWLSPPTASFTTVSTTVCAGTAMLYTNLSTGGQTSYTWAFQGGTPATSTSTNPSIVYNVPGTYSVALTASNAIGSNGVTQINYITVTPTIAPSVTITQSGGSNPMCAGAAASFSASYTNGGPVPGFQWKVNGVNTGIITSTYTTSGLTNPAVVTCVMTSNAVCANPVSATSAPITMTINSTAPATASIVLTSGSNPMCNGSPAGFSVTTGNGGTAPTYQWKINGLNAGNNSPNFTTNALLNGDFVNCIVSSNAPCASATLAVSAGITMTVSSLLVPQVLIGFAGANNFFCQGAPVTLTATAVNGGGSPSYQWLVNGLNSGTGSSTFTASNLNNGAILTCVLLSNLTCSSPNTATSSAVTVSVNPIPPTPTISAQSSGTFCAGGNVVLNSSAQTGNLWTNGTTTPSMIVSATGTFAVAQTLNGCVSLPSQQFSVLVNPLPAVNMQTLSAICRSEGDISLSLGAPTGGTYNGTGVAGNIFSPAQSGIGNFIIVYSYTDNNNCSGTASITLNVDECSGLIEKANENSGISVFPNPTSGQITIHSKKEKILSVKVADQNGKLILKQPGNNENFLTLDLSKEAAGIYIIDIVLKRSVIHKQISKKD